MVRELDRLTNKATEAKNVKATTRAATGSICR